MRVFVRAASELSRCDVLVLVRPLVCRFRVPGVSAHTAHPLDDRPCAGGSLATFYRLSYWIAWVLMH